MIKVNLLPKEIQDKGKGVEWVILGGALIGLFAVVAMSSYFIMLQSYKKELKRKVAWSRQLAEIKAKVTQVAQLDAQIKVLNAKKNTVVQLLQGRLLYPRMMESFYESLPKDVWITGLTMKEESNKNIKIVAKSNALTIDAIADWLQTLETKPGRYSGVELSAIDVKGELNDDASFDFSMTFTYIPPPPGT